jgi:hypothetical protein
LFFYLFLLWQGSADRGNAKVKNETEDRASPIRLRSDTAAETRRGEQKISREDRRVGGPYYSGTATSHFARPGVAMQDRRRPSQKDATRTKVPLLARANFQHGV